MKDETPLRFTLGAAFGGVCYYPANPSAVAVVPGGRKALRGDEIAALASAGARVQIGIPEAYGKPPLWASVSPAPDT
jgi:hypothetical protein